MTFKADLLTDVKQVFLGGNDEFDESVTYTPGVGSAKSINALVVRDSLEPVKETAGRSLRNQAEVIIANDATAGVATIDKTRDKITLNDREETSRKARIVEIIGSDDGVWHLRVEW